MSDHDDIHDLLVRTPAPHLAYDVDATLSTGRRIRRRRRLGAIGGAAAVAAAVAIGYGAVPLPGRDAQPAGQQQSEAVSAELLDYRYAVEVRPGANGTAEITSYSVDRGKRTRLASWTAEPGKVSMAPDVVGDGVRLGVAPATARTIVPLGEAAPLPVFTERKPLPNTTFQAIGFRGNAGLERESLKDVIWTDATSSRDSAGEALPSLPSSEGDVTTVLVPQQRLLLDTGLSQAGNAEGSGSSYPVGSVPWRAERLAPMAGGIQVLAATFVLPTEGKTPRDITVTWTSGVTTTAMGIEPSLGWTFVFTQREPSAKDGQGQIVPTSISWVDESGTKHTERVLLDRD